VEDGGAHGRLGGKTADEELLGAALFEKLGERGARAVGGMEGGIPLLGIGGAIHDSGSPGEGQARGKGGSTRAGDAVGRLRAVAEVVAVGRVPFPADDDQAVSV